MSVEEDIADLIRNNVAGIGEVFQAGMPDLPNNATCVMAIDGGKAEPFIKSPAPEIVDHIIDIRIRNESPSTARSLMESALDKCVKFNTDIGTHFFLWLRPASPYRTVDRDPENVTTLSAILYARTRGL